MDSVMGTTPIAEWSGFFTAAAGALGALVGLVFVSLSINLARIIALPGMTGRAGETLGLLAGSLAGTLAVLVPNLSSQQLASVLLLIALPTWLLPMISQLKALQAHTRQSDRLTARRALLHQFAALPGVLASLALHGWLPGGLAWFALGVVASILVAVLNSWVLLVEILR